MKKASIKFRRRVFLVLIGIFSLNSILLLVFIDLTSSIGVANEHDGGFTNTIKGYTKRAKKTIERASLNESSAGKSNKPSDVVKIFASYGIVIDPEDDNTWPLMASNRQVTHLGSDQRVERYEAALGLLKDPTNLSQVDPLGVGFIEPNATNRLPFVPKVQYLGVLVDAGRNYFPIPWLKRLIKYMYRLHFNMLHLRLTDDQAFNIRLNSYPQLAKPSPSFPSTTYTPEELKALVAFAKEFNISIIPEINVPGHAGAWSGIPNMTVHCPKFACEVGFGIPMNVSHGDLKTILKSILREIIDIFDYPPFLHLGGDEVHKSEECFQEIGIEPFEYYGFEESLKTILREVDYPADKVIRWEVTGPHVSNATMVNQRAGVIQHHWYNLPGHKLSINPNHTYLSSWRLYMDKNDNDGAAQIFNNTLKNFLLSENSTNYSTTAIIPAAFELDTHFWMQRNVAARLIAVAMGAAQLPLTEPEHVMVKYEELCKYMGLHPTVCDLQGMIPAPTWRFKKEWKGMWNTWRINGTCPTANSDF